jgi:hypothetical protein
MPGCGDGSNYDQKSVENANLNEDSQTCNLSDLYKCVSEKYISAQKELFDHACHIVNENSILK